MPTQSKIANPPQGLARLLYRAPIFFYRLGLGRLMGGRFLLLTHVGRKSGLERQVVLEVVHRDTESGAYYVAAGFGPRSDWYLNALKEPKVHVQVTNRSWPALAEVLDVPGAKHILLQYAQKHPSAAKSLAKLMGYRTDGSAEDFASLGTDLKLIRLSPR